MKQATQKLWKAIRLSPNILMSKEALLLVIKLALLRILSPKIASNILSKTIRVRKAADPRLQTN